MLRRWGWLPACNTVLWADGPRSCSSFSWKVKLIYFSGMLMRLTSTNWKPALLFSTVESIPAVGSIHHANHTGRSERAIACCVASRCQFEVLGWNSWEPRWTFLSQTPMIFPVGAPILAPARLRSTSLLWAFRLLLGSILRSTACTASNEIFSWASLREVV